MFITQRSAPSSPLLVPSYEVAPRSDSEESDSDYEEEVRGHLSLFGVCWLGSYRRKKGFLMNVGSDPEASRPLPPDFVFRLFLGLSTWIGSGGVCLMTVVIS